VIPDRIRWAVETLAVERGDRLVEIGGGPGVAASLVCERLDRGSLLLIDRSTTAIERTRRRNLEHVGSGRLALETVDVANFDPGIVSVGDPDRHVSEPFGTGFAWHGSCLQLALSRSRHRCRTTSAPSSVRVALLC
jgi:hypothetical protein